jgi:hypothetical protein
MDESPFSENETHLEADGYWDWIRIEQRENRITAVRGRYAAKSSGVLDGRE